MSFSRAIPCGIGATYRAFPGARAPEGAEVVAKGAEEAVKAEEAEDATDRLNLRQIYEEEPSPGAGGESSAH
jgi:hypothetical protein